jgi:hypothetical protein
MMYMMPARSEEWLTFRKGYVSATEVASLVGVNSYLSMSKLHKQKNSTSLDKIDNAHMRDGRAAEGASYLILQEMGWKLEPLAPRGEVMVFTDESLKISSTPDIFRWNPPAVVEVKKTTRKNFEANWCGTLPPLRYLAQIQVQMHTTQLHEGYLCCVVFEDDIPISIYKVVYSPKFIELVGEQLTVYRDSSSEAKKLVKGVVKKEATKLLTESFIYDGIYRFGGREADLEEIFKDG